MGSLMTSSSSAGPIQISKFPEPWYAASDQGVHSFPLFQQFLDPWTGSKMDFFNHFVTMTYISYLES